MSAERQPCNWQACRRSHRTDDKCFAWCKCRCHTTGAPEPTTTLCAECGKAFDPAKDSFITFHERKGPSLNFDTLACLTAHVNDEDRP